MPKLPNLYRTRVSRALSQRDLSERSGASRVTIARIEAGGDARYVTTRKLAEALGVEPSELIGPIDGEQAREGA
jgi:transcriptional regulator with XRE-family HTH domain